MSEQRVFVCDVEPLGDGAWELWISEEPYRGVETDAALGEWDRQRIGGTWTHRRLVGRKRTRITAEMTARTAVRKAEVRAADDERSRAEWQAALRQAFRTWANAESSCEEWARRHPAEPDAGDVQALDEISALALAEEIWEDEPTEAEQLLMQRVVSSDYLADLLAAARREGGASALEEAAADFRRGDGNSWAQHVRTWLRDRATAARSTP